MDSDADMKLIIALDKSGREASVVLRCDASQEDVLEAYVQGYLLLHSTAPMVCSRHHRSTQYNLLAPVHFAASLQSKSQGVSWSE